MNTPADLKKAQSAAPKHTGFLLAFISTKDEETTEMVTEFIKEVAEEYNSVIVHTIDTDCADNSTLLSTFQITTSPTFITLLDKGTIEHIQGFDAPTVIGAVDALVTKATLYQKIDGIINQSKWVLFMKGNKDAPRCGFSRKMCDLLTNNGLSDFTTFDILGDQDVREGIKVYSKWPTFPQLYCDGELLGGLDVISEMVEAGEFAELLE